MAGQHQTPFATAGLKDLSDEPASLWPDELPGVAGNLLSAAVQCFASKGYHATTTRDISMGAGLSPAALYVYFESKELVLYEIIRAGHQRALIHVTEPAIEQIENASERLCMLVLRHTEWHARHHVAARVCQYELASLSAEHYEEIHQIRRRTNDVFRAAVNRGVEEGTFAKVDVNRSTRAILSLSIDLVRWYRRDGGDSPEQLGQFNSKLALKMVS